MTGLAFDLGLESLIRIAALFLLVACGQAAPYEPVQCHTDTLTLRDSSTVLRVPIRLCQKP